jgi:Holliday junction resolvase
MKPPVLKEKDITMQIRNLLKTFQIFHWKNHGGPMGAKGVPDILGCYQGKFLGIEVKTEKGKPSPEQVRFIQNLNDAGGIAFIARSVDDVIEKLGLQKRLLF